MTSGDIDQAGRAAAWIALTETTFGSFLHAWKIPLSGHLLSLNQGYFLARLSRHAQGAPASLAWRSSLVVAILKSLSPAGKRLTPMLAISAQGALFSLGVCCGGTQFWGLWLGFALLSLWAFLQPLLIYGIIFGSDILPVLEASLQRIQPYLPLTLRHVFYAFTFLLILKLAAAAYLSALALSRSPKYERLLKQHLPMPSKKTELRSPALKSSQKWLCVARDLLQPWFLLSWILTGAFFYFQDPHSVQWVWMLLRPLAIATCLFYALRFLPLRHWLLQRLPPSSLSARILRKALQSMGDFSPDQGLPALEDSP